MFQLIRPVISQQKPKILFEECCLTSQVIDEKLQLTGWDNGNDMRDDTQNNLSDPTIYIPILCT